MKSHIIKVGDINIGKGEPLVVIAGPCVIENEKSALYHAEKLVETTSRLNIPFIYKSSYDKANRTSVNSFRGPGIKKGLSILKKVKKTFGIPVLSDVHCRQEIGQASSVLDIIQIPAFLSRQTDLIIAVAKMKKPINIKKAQFMAPWDIRYIIEKIETAGNYNIIITERGSCFGYNNLVSDMRSLPIMRDFGYPVVFDATHSVQLPGGMKSYSGGQREFVSGLTRAAVAMGIDGLFLETHCTPDKAPSDALNMIDLKEFGMLLKQVKAISTAMGIDV